MYVRIPDESFKQGFIEGQKVTTDSIAMYLKGEASVLPSPIS